MTKIEEAKRHLKNLIDATEGQARVTGKESIRVRMARNRAAEFVALLENGAAKKGGK